MHRPTESLRILDTAKGCMVALWLALSQNTTEHSLVRKVARISTLSSGRCGFAPAFLYKLSRHASIPLHRGPSPTPFLAETPLSRAGRSGHSQTSCQANLTVGIAATLLVNTSLTWCRFGKCQCNGSSCPPAWRPGSLLPRWGSLQREWPHGRYWISTGGNKCHRVGVVVDEIDNESYRNWMYDMPDVITIVIIQQYDSREENRTLTAEYSTWKSSCV